MGREPTCEQRIEKQLDSRMEDLLAIDTVLNNGADEDIEAAVRVLAGSFGVDITPTSDEDDLRDAAETALMEWPLSATKQVVWRVDLSTGGPGDWFEFYVDSDGDLERIEYHFNDWFDHAQRSISHDTDRWNALETAFGRWVGEDPNA